MDIKQKFLQGILGSDGAGALRKAVQKDSRLGPIVLPRAIIGWLSFISRYDYEGALPNIENSYIQFTKNEDSSFSGSIAIDDIVHEFDNTDIYHVASAISVSLGEDEQNIDTDLRDLVLVRLGKSIDTLAKAQEVTRTLERRLHVPTVDLTKAIAAIPKGTETTDGHDYSHVLKPEHKQAGYSVKVQPTGTHNGKQHLEANVYHGNHPDPIGTLEAYHSKGVMEPSVSLIAPEHKGKGLGQAMYEAMFAHGYHNGVHTIQGDVHSTDAANVHSKLASKHGMAYEPMPNYGNYTPYHNPDEWISKPNKQYDQKYQPYKYTLKQEIPMEKIDLPGRTHVPAKQQGPAGAIAPSKQTRLPRPNNFKTPSLKIGKSEASRKCDVCDGTQFTNNKFTGCICFRAESPLIKTTVYGDGLVLDFKKEASVELYLVLSKYFRGQ